MSTPGDDGPRPMRREPIDVRARRAALDNTEPAADTATPSAPRQPEGWYADPGNPAGLRYWDGAAWTPHVAGIPAPPPAVSRGTGRIVLIVVAAVTVGLVGIVVVAIVAVQFLGTTAKDKLAMEEAVRTDPGPFTIVMRPVDKVTTSGCAEPRVVGADGSCFELGSRSLTLRGNVAVAQDGAQWKVTIDPSRTTSAALASLTSDCASRSTGCEAGRVALVRVGSTSSQVIAAPTVDAPMVGRVTFAVSTEDRARLVERAVQP